MFPITDNSLEMAYMMADLVCVSWTRPTILYVVSVSQCEGLRQILLLCLYLLRAEVRPRFRVYLYMKIRQSKAEYLHP